MLDLCGNPAKAGQVCISLADELSNVLMKATSSSSDDNEKSDNLVLISMIQELLFYAKLQFINANGGIYVALYS